MTASGCSFAGNEWFPPPSSSSSTPNTLFPASLRDTLLRAAAEGYYQLRWSAEILDEMEHNLVSTGTMSAEKASNLRTIMEGFFPEALVTGYESLVGAMRNNERDRHIAAAAVKCGAQVIVTSNLRDFAELPSGLEAQSPDEFLCNMFDLDPERFVQLLRDQAADLVKPPVTFEELLCRLKRVVPELVHLVSVATAAAGD